MIATRKVDLASILGGVYPLEAWRDAFVAMESGASDKSVLRITA